MKNANLRELYKVKLGKYSDDYVVTEVALMKTPFTETTLKRIRQPISKIDGIRLPNTISITLLGKPAINKKRKK